MNSRRVVIYGDSVGAGLKIAGMDTQAQTGIPLTMSDGASPRCRSASPGEGVDTGPESTPSSCRKYWSALLANETLNPNVVLVVEGSPIDESYVVSRSETEGCDVEFGALGRRDLAEFVDFLHGRDIVPIVATMPYRRDPGHTTPDAETDCRNDDIRTIASTRPEMIVVDLKSWVCPTAACRTTLLGHEFRPDGLHYGDEAAQIVFLWLLRQGLGPWSE